MIVFRQYFTENICLIVSHIILTHVTGVLWIWYTLVKMGALLEKLKIIIDDDDDCRNYTRNLVNVGSFYCALHFYILQLFYKIIFEFSPKSQNISLFISCIFSSACFSL